MANEMLTRWALTDLIAQLKSVRSRLDEPVIADILSEKLHPTNEGVLPDKQLVGLAAEVVDLLHGLQQKLEPNHLVLADHFFGYMSTKCLVGVLELGVPDALSQQSLTIERLATAVHARPDRLRQVMRTLCNNGLFAFDPATETYSNNARSAMLTKGHWTQWRNWVDLYGNEFYEIARGIPASLKADTERSAAQHAFDTDDDMFTYFQKQGWVPRLHRTLGGGAAAQAPGIVADYPWSEVEDCTVLDIGGGGGGFIATLLRGFPKMHGGVFDLSKVIDYTKPLFQSGGVHADVAPRVSQDDLIAGDFFQDIPSYEVYTMKWCLHDWSDKDAACILANIRKAIKPGPKSRLVVLESVLSDGEMGRLSRYGDINMMMTAKGQERMEKTWYALAAETKWELRRIYPLRNAWVNAIEMRPE